MGKGVHAVVQGLSAHTQLPGHKGNKNGRGAGCHAPLNFNAVIAKGQRGHKALLLLPVQPLDGAVVFLCDAAHGKHIVFQPLTVGCKVYHRKGQQKHSLIPGLQVGQQLGGVLGKGNEVGRQNLHIVPCPDSLFLFLGFHAANIGNFALDGFDGFKLIHRLNVHGDSQLRIQFQNLSKELVRQLRRQNLQIGHRTPIAAHPESAAVPEVEAVRGDIVLGAKAVFGNVLPRKAERLPVAGVHLAVKQGQPPPPVQGLGLHPQPVEVAHHIGLHTLQPWPGLGHTLGGEPKGNIFCALNAVVAFGNLIFQHPGKFLPDAVELVLAGRDVDLITASVTGTAVDKGKLERQGAVKIIKE